MDTYDNMQKNQPLLFRIQDFLKANLGLAVIFVGFLCVVIGGFYLSDNHLQDVIFLIAAVYFLISIFLLWLSHKGSPLPPFFKSSKHWILSLFLICASLCSFILDDNHYVTLPILVCVLCIVTHRITIYYSKKWHVEDLNLFKELISVEQLGVVIAGLQLIIAFPQLKMAYKSVTSDNITVLYEEIANFNNHIDNFAFVSIPDSLIDDDVHRAMMFQRQLYTASLYIVNTNWSSDIFVDADNVATYINTPAMRRILLSNDLSRKNESLLKEYTYEILASAEIVNIAERMQANYAGLASGIRILQTINSYYETSADSSLLATQIDGNLIKSVAADFDRLSERTDILRAQTSATYDLICEICADTGMSINDKVKKLRKVVKKQQKHHCDYYNDPSFEQSIKGIDKIFMDYISFLNLVQLEHAYDVPLVD